MITKIYKGTMTVGDLRCEFDKILYKQPAAARDKINSLPVFVSSSGDESAKTFRWTYLAKGGVVAHGLDTAEAIYVELY